MELAHDEDLDENLFTWASLLLLSCSLFRCLSLSILACSAGLGIGATGLVVGGVTVCGGAGAGLGCRGATGAAGAALSTGTGLLINTKVKTNLNHNDKVNNEWCLCSKHEQRF